MIRIPLRLFAALALVALTAVRRRLWFKRRRLGRLGQQDRQMAPPPRARRAASSSSSAPLTSTSSTPARPTTRVASRSSTPPRRRSTPSSPAIGGRRARTSPRASPEISEDKKSVTVTLKKGVKFAPPVNREIQAKDVKYAFERAFTKNVPNQYTTYFNFIEGAPTKPGAMNGHLGHRGRPERSVQDHVQAHARRRPRASPHFLVMPVTTPVPKEYAKKFDKKSPSTYNENVVASGPYMVENDASGQARRGYKAGKSIELVRNPNWDAAKDYQPRLPRRDPDAHERDRRQRVRPSGASGREPDARRQPAGAGAQAGRPASEGPAQDRSRAAASAGSRSTTTIKPLDDLNVRKAILAAFDREAAIKARGGSFVGKPGTHFIPPGIGGFEEAGGDEGPGLRLPGQPEGRHGRGREVHEGRRLRLRQVRRHGRAADGHRERRPGQGPGRGREGPAREARLQDPPPHGPAGRGLHGVVPAAGQEGRRLRLRGLVQGLQRPAVDARADVQGLELLAGGRQQQPVPAPGSEDRQGHGRRRPARGRRAQPGLG